MPLWFRRHLFILPLAIAGLLSCGGVVPAAAAGPTITWRAGYQAASDSLEAVWINAFGDAVEKGTQGRIKVLRFPAGQLGSGDVQLREVQQGALDLTLINTDLAGALSPQFTVFSTPFLFPSLAAADAVVAGPVGAEYLKAFDQYGLTGLTVQSHSMRDILSNKPIHSAADMKGLKIRTQGSSAINRMYESLGAVPIAIAPSEIITALKTGTVQAIDSVCWFSWTSKHYEAARYDVELNNIAGSFVVVLRQDAFRQLTPADQAAVRAASRAADAQLKQKRNAAISDAINGMRAAGLVTTMPDQLDLNSFRSAILANGMPVVSDPAWQKLYADTRQYIESHKLK